MKADNKDIKAPRAPISRGEKAFSSKDLQVSLALVVVISLIFGIGLHTAAHYVVSVMGVDSTVLTVLLIIGYVLIVIILPVIFTHRFVGPFKRIEYEMKFISSGDLKRRLSVRSRDDLHIRNFIGYVNSFVDGFERLDKDYVKLRDEVAVELERVRLELAKDSPDCARLRSDALALLKKMKEFKRR